MTKPHLFRYLMSKLNQAFCEEWDASRLTRVEVVEQNDLTGVRFLVRRRDGSWSIAHEEPPVALVTPEDVDTLLARGLSIFLMKHPCWPR